MKSIITVLILVHSLFASIISAPIVSLDDTNTTAVIKIPKIDVGMSGFVVHQLNENHSSIVKSAVVRSFDATKGEATIELGEYTLLRNSALPEGMWGVHVGDDVKLAFAYSRALLVAPSEEIYHRITKSSPTLQWIHPDIFATLLSYNGHPTPLKKDFDEFCNTTSVGVLFFFLNKHVFTLDAVSFKILHISQLDLETENLMLPFYSRVKEIDASWWGEGSDELESYEPYYYGLLVEYNKQNKELYEIVKNGGESLSELVEDFEIGESL